MLLPFFNLCYLESSIVGAARMPLTLPSMEVTKSYLVALYLIVLGINVALASGQCQADQKELLLDLKGNLSFDRSWSAKLVTWDSRRDCCEWRGVSCDPGGLGRVIGLDLSGEGISGTAPSGIFSLQYLRNLNLAFNNFNTTIPVEISNLTELAYLNLNDAGFTSQVPVQLSQMEKLVILDLSFSSLVLENPNLASIVRNMSKLTELYLDGMSLSKGGKDWCQVLSSSLPNLQVLSLSNCNLSGSIDSSLANLKFLTTINLKGNNFSGLVSDTIFHGSSLETINLSGYPKLDISFPEFHQNQSLRNLLLSGTKISGGLPQSIGYLKNLSRVELSFCMLTGAIPSSMTNLEQLVYLDLSHNLLEGVVPSLHRSTKLEYLALSYNQLSGEIPSSYLQGILNLNTVDLRHNLFSGTIPSSLFEIPLLQQVQLSSNRFGGQIPEFPSASTSILSTLDLSSNNLVGLVPSSIFNLSKLYMLSVSSNKLNGLILLDWVTNLVDLAHLDLSNNNLTVEVACTEQDTACLPQFLTLKLASCSLTKFPHLGNQSRLQSLNISNNNIPEVLPWLERFATGPLSRLDLSLNIITSLPDFTNFHNLAYLDVHGNQLTGEIPVPPPRAYFVDYSSNNFNCSIPLEFGNSMNFTMSFSLANNSLSGGIPESICSATNLLFLDLSNNHLNGQIPTCLTGINLRLGVLNFRRNRLSGTIPDNFQANCGLQTLDLSNNVLHGEVPGTLANCTRLEVLNIGNNQVNGSFPCALKISLSNLRVLILRNNQFHGRISCPAVQGSWDKLQIVDLAQNQFDGVLPYEVLLTWRAMMEGGNESHGTMAPGSVPVQGYSVTVYGKDVQLVLVKIQTYFTSIDFSYNRLEGPLPEAISKFKALYLLNLSHNSFNGPILPSIGNLSMLESLDLSANKFSGAIPEQLAALPFLSFLNVSDNKLTGEIPKSTQIQSFAASCFEDNAGLCGLPLPQSCHRTGGSSDPLGSSHEKWEMDWQFTLAAGMGFAMGAAAVVAPLVYDKAFNRWCDDRADRIHMMLVSYFSRG